MFTTLKVTSWSGVVSTLHVTGLRETPEGLIAFDKRDPDTGHVVRSADGRAEMDGFFVRSDQPGRQTIKKIEVFAPSGALIDTHLGQPPIDEAAPKRAKKAA
ncbi:MAG: hypothetical protein ACOC20_06360 [Oceanicaulis sp.]